MPSKAEQLRSLYLDLAGEETITESQLDEQNRDPVESSDAALTAEVSGYLREDGLEEALDGVESNAGVSA